MNSYVKIQRQCAAVLAWLMAIVSLTGGMHEAEARGYFYHLSGTISSIDDDDLGLIEGAGQKVGSEVQYLYYVDVNRVGTAEEYSRHIYKFPAPWFYAKQVSGDLLRDESSANLRPRNGVLATNIGEPVNGGATLVSQGVNYMARTLNGVPFIMNLPPESLGWGESYQDAPVQDWQIGQQVLFTASTWDKYGRASSLTAHISVDWAMPAGGYTLVFRPEDAGNSLQGSGYASMTIQETGTVIIAGTLPDGERFRTAAALASAPGGPQLSLFVPLKYQAVQARGSEGLLTGTLVLPTETGSTAVSGSLQWNKPAQTRGRSQDQLQTVLNVIGSTYVPATSGSSVLPGFDMGSLRLTDTRALSMSGSSDILNAVTLNANNTVTVTDPGTDRLRIRIEKSTGVFKGSFYYPATGRRAKLTDFGGVVLQGGTSGAGLFLGPGGSGEVELEAGP